jgi:predicted DNA-binding transcriptional regulator YafY
MNYYKRDKKITFTKVWCRGSIMRDLPRHVLAKSTVDPIIQAFASEVEIEITYEKFRSGTNTVRIVQPIAIGCADGKYYLIAYCKLRNDYRTFNFSRIKKITLSDQPLPPLDFNENFMLKQITILQQNLDVTEKELAAAQRGNKFRLYVIIGLSLLLFGSCSNFSKKRTYTDEDRTRQYIMEKMEEESSDDYFGRAGVSDIRGL